VHAARRGLLGEESSRSFFDEVRVGGHHATLVKHGGARRAARRPDGGLRDAGDDGLHRLAAGARQGVAGGALGQDVIATLADALLGGGRDSLTRGQYAEAVGRFVEYVRLGPTDAHGYLALGRAYLGSGRYADALGSVRRGLAQPGDAAVRQDLTATLLTGGRQALANGADRDRGAQGIRAA
jgi:tetratricopeptide (TPR) repeat protein